MTGSRKATVTVSLDNLALTVTSFYINADITKCEPLLTVSNFVTPQTY